MNESFLSKRKQSPTEYASSPQWSSKDSKKKNTILAIEHVFVWCIVYKQGVVSMNIRISKKIKCQGSCGKLVCYVYLVRNANFACKTLNQAL
jgi:hypothetical protein